MNDEVLLRVENLSQYFKLGHSVLKAVDHVTFDIHRGEVFGLVGESGCGKTTTGRTIIRIYNPSTGSVYFKGQRIGAGTEDYVEGIKFANQCYQERVRELNSEKKEAIAKIEKDYESADPQTRQKAVADAEKLYSEKLKEAAETRNQTVRDFHEKIRSAKYDQNHVKREVITKIQMIFQDPIASLNPRMTVKDIIAEGLVIQGCRDRKYMEDRVFEMLELVGLVREHAERYPHEFSGGQRQRIGIARAIIMNPELIIADEPVSALDVSIQAQVINLLNELREKMGLTILFIAHNLSVVKYFSDRIGVMYFGKMVELATSEELFKHPLHPYTRSLLSAIPLPDPDYEKDRKRFTYNPLAEHDYSVQQPTFREVYDGHFVLCNDEEFEKYRKQVEESEDSVVESAAEEEPVKEDVVENAEAEVPATDSVVETE